MIVRRVPLSGCNGTQPEPVCNPMVSFCQPPSDIEGLRLDEALQGRFDESFLALNPATPMSSETCWSSIRGPMWRIGPLGTPSRHQLGYIGSNGLPSAVETRDLAEFSTSCCQEPQQSE